MLQALRVPVFQAVAPVSIRLTINNVSSNQGTGSSCAMYGSLRQTGGGLTISFLPLMKGLTHIHNSTFSYNRADSGGGLNLYLHPLVPNPPQKMDKLTVTISSTQIHHNRATKGGGIYTAFYAERKDAEALDTVKKQFILRYVNLYNNQAEYGGGTYF